MKITKSDVKSISATSSIKKTGEISTESVKATETSSKTVSGISSQMQLLNLARQFVVDGALLSPDKQMPLEDRVSRRKRYKEFRKQQNLETIIQKAIQYCSDSEVTDRADQDWFNYFTEFAEGVSNNTMQDLWAKILANEVSQPGSFSLKTLQAFKTMSITEAKIFAKACSLAVRDQSKKNLRIISGSSQMPGIFNFFSKDRDHRINLNKLGLSYAELLTLADNHLLFIQETESAPFAQDETIHFHYNGKPISLTAYKDKSMLSFYKFTPVGTELANLIADNSDGKYLQILAEKISPHFSLKA